MLLLTAGSMGLAHQRLPVSPAKVAALAAFREHADATNDIFHLAAKVVAGALLDAESVLEQYPAQGECFPAQP